MLQRRPVQFLTLFGADRRTDDRLTQRGVRDGRLNLSSLSRHLLYGINEGERERKKTWHTKNVRGETNCLAPSWLASTEHVISTYVLRFVIQVLAISVIDIFVE